MIFAILVFAAAILVAMIANGRVQACYEECSQIPAKAGLTGAEAGRRILDHAGLVDVKIVEKGKTLGDHYDPGSQRIVLSPENFRGSSTAALGIAAHECGHAIQHADGYKPLALRISAVRIASLASLLLIILPAIGILTRATRPMLILLALSWGAVMVLNLITLPVEFDASYRARKSLRELDFVREGVESRGVEKMLFAAALTYVAAFMNSLSKFMSQLLPLGRRI